MLFPSEIHQKSGEKNQIDVHLFNVNKTSNISVKLSRRQSIKSDVAFLLEVSFAIENNKKMKFVAIALFVVAASVCAGKS